MNIYVGNLAYGVTEEELQELFGQYGAITSVSIIKDSYTGKSKGFGFVEMEQNAEGEEAVKNLDDSSMSGRNIKVSQARPRSDKPKPRRRTY